MTRFFRIASFLILSGIFTTSLSAQGVLTFEDVMKFEDISSTTFSSEGNWVAYGVWPDRGDGYILIQHTGNGTEYKIDLADRPAISFDEKWVAAQNRIPLAVQLKEKNKAPKPGLSLLALATGEITVIDSVTAFGFSNDGKWIAIKHHQTKEIEDLKSKNRRLGTALTLMNLAESTSFDLGFVNAFEFDSLSSYLAYSVVDTSGSGNGVFVFDLKGSESLPIDQIENGYVSNLTWEPESSNLAYTSVVLDSSFTESDATLKLWVSGNRSLQTLVSPEDTDDAYALRSNNRLSFTNDGKRLFFGLMSQAMVDLDAPAEKEEDEEIDIYDIEEIVGDRGMDMWHGDDPLIKTHEIATWNSRKNHGYTAVYHLDKGEWKQLADFNVPDVSATDNSVVALGYTDEPYAIEITWDGTYRDWFTIDLETGEKAQFLEHYGGFAQLSPTGKFAVYYENEHWFLYDIEKAVTRNLTEGIETPFYNEDHDYPSDVPGYGTGGWTEKDEHVLIYDKYDIWKFPTNGGTAVNITGGEGRAEKRIFRIESLDDDRIFKSNEEVFLTSYHDLRKNHGFYSARLNRTGVSKILEENKKFTFVSKAEESDKILYKREAYDEFPNLWVADNRKFKGKEQVSQLHMDLKERWNWGSAELVDWLSLDGTYIQGVVIKPDNYDPNKRYPIMTYYYRFFTNNLHDFNEPKTNHRPVFAQYVSDEYVVFLPDVRFEIGRPGFAATKSVVPGIQKLIELGIADEDKLGLHGHSWSGYQTAFIVTQTDIFDAAVSGAPVSNMTSAYSGIRWASGMARQFQYEKTQSRIGESLIEAPEKYIENSPVFFANKITTPMLIQHGDADGAVPWYQSIEMYLAMRRYDKDVIFLQYHDEPHHLQKFSNKLDYAIRMKEYFDYYLKGVGEPEWIISGEPFQGR